LISGQSCVGGSDEGGEKNKKRLTTMFDCIGSYAEKSVDVQMQGSGLTLLHVAVTK